MARVYVDPITGDSLTLGERTAWIVTGFVRRWSVFFAIQAAAVLWLSLGDAAARDWYNYVWSDWAIVIENITMLALFAQARRDAVVMRKVLVLEEQNQALHQQNLDLLRRMDHLIEHDPDVPPLPEGVAA